MDDSLEVPTSTLQPIPTHEQHGENDEGSIDDEDEGPDWTKLPNVLRPVIPKRGEKDFEPSVQGGSGLQRHVLDRSRSAMFDALKATRTTASKSMSYGIWYPELARTHVTTVRGTHFVNMGHSVDRDAPASGGVPHEKIGKRLELLPEEALYLVERGAMFCWKASDYVAEDIEGEPMTVQQAFAEMIGKEDLTLEKYQVFAYLKRLGYVVTRTKPPSPAYPPAAPFSSLSPQSDLSSKPSIFRRFFMRLFDPVLLVLRKLFGRASPFDWWRPIRLHHNLQYTAASLFSALRFLPYGYNAELHLKKPEAPSPYEIFYNLYKPNTPFKKSAPPAPDFSVVVVNARTTPMPSLYELSALFDQVPYLPPPTPRRRLPFVAPKTKSSDSKPQPSPASTPLAPQSYLRQIVVSVRRLFPFPPFQSTQAGQDAKTHPMPRRVNPFAVLKAGKKIVIVAAVDAGTISFFRFGQGAFEDFPMN
ncbi:hypothetical protein NM688_g625 [Phlebia brevispora]|uniref:Uncharacterized protein n=1 Tax=Phlebia brevispora TaxID=194682 RepID=A0ACC1TDH0_9APHY|nr:hypothetical protein NM688_g625 [Phlebia brevispora]